jgi:NADH-quinone oxidoreductase subunit D
MSTTSDPAVGADEATPGSVGTEHVTERDAQEASQRRPDESDVTVMEPFATAEGRQEMRSREELSATELLRQSGAVLRIGEAEAERLAEETARGDDETMIINMGPQHPSTHGVLRVMLELQGETVLRTKPVIGYLHTGMEKTAEELTFLQGTTNTTRMDYLSNMHNELVFALATETLLGITGDMPARATWIRMFMCELQRIASHLLFFATNGMDMASTTSMIFGIRERDAILRFFEQASGLRMNYNYIRVGGVAADLPDGWEDTVTRLLDELEPKLVEHDELFSGQPIWHGRSQGVGVIGPEEAVALGATGPILRAAGVPWDLRRDEPHLAYDEVDFDVIVGTHGDTFDRYAVRMNEIRESIKIVRQCIARMPAGDWRIQDRKVTPPPRARIDESMEALIHHFKIFTEGFRVPEGEAYAAVETARGELGCYLVSDGSAKPYRMHIRGPSFVNIQTLPHLMREGLVADAVAVISSIDPVMGEVDR